MNSIQEVPSGAENQIEPLPTDFSSLIAIPGLLERVTQLGYTIPTPVQAHAIGPATKGKDLLIQAKTGSGKTLAFALPLLAQLAAAEKPSTLTTVALIVTPTRELANQIGTVIKALTDDVAPVVVIGGAEQKDQQKALKEDPRIVVGTPGRLLDLIKQKILQLKHCSYFVLDEADEMLSMGFIDDVRAILSRLPDKRQGLFVSATLTPRVEMLAHSFLTKPERIMVDSYATDIPSIEHTYVEVGGELMSKPWALCDIIETLRPRSAIIFCNTKSDTQLVEVLLRRRGFDARRINSDLTQNQREKIIQKIRDQELQFLVATDIAARGIDIEQIDLVVNYNIHEQPETYIHRTGRTGRAGRFGRAISLVGPRDFGAFHYLTKVVDFDLKKSTLPTDEEVAAARLAHLYELIRTTEIKLTEREMLVAKKLLSDRGNVTEAPEELVEMVAKLTQFAIEHFVNLEARSLEEELDAAQARQSERADQDWGEGREDKRRRPSRDDGDSRRGRSESRDRGDRGRDRGRDRERGEGREARTDSRPNRDESKSGDSRNERNERNERGERNERSERNDRGRESRPPRDRRNSGERVNNPSNKSSHNQQQDEVRLYIGQGHIHGMTEALFSQLVQEVAGLSANRLRHLSLREYYGFVDADKTDADKILENLSGIEYNGATLVIEAANVAEARSDRGRGPRRERHR